MNEPLREFVRQRAKHRCEYCRLPQAALAPPLFHVEHIVAMQHGGTDDPENLALACDRCNLFKGPNLTAIDPLTNQVVSLFNPRKDEWSKHFQYIRYEIEGITEIGRATVRLLNMNSFRRVQLRSELQLRIT